MLVENIDMPQSNMEAEEVMPRQRNDQVAQPKNITVEYAPFGYWSRKLISYV